MVINVRMGERGKSCPRESETLLSCGAHSEHVIGLGFAAHMNSLKSATFVS